MHTDDHILHVGFRQKKGQIRTDGCELAPHLNITSFFKHELIYSTFVICLILELRHLEVVT